jgi:hypothetical protein
VSVLADEKVLVGWIQAHAVPDETPEHVRVGRVRLWHDVHMVLQVRIVIDERTFDLGPVDEDDEVHVLHGQVDLGLRERPLALSERERDDDLVPVLVVCLVE